MIRVSQNFLTLKDLRWKYSDLKLNITIAAGYLGLLQNQYCIFVTFDPSAFKLNKLNGTRLQELYMAIILTHFWFCIDGLFLTELWAPFEWFQFDKMFRYILLHLTGLIRIDSCANVNPFGSQNSRHYNRMISIQKLKGRVPFP